MFMSSGSGQCGFAYFGGRESGMRCIDPAADRRDPGGAESRKFGSTILYTMAM